MGEGKEQRPLCIIEDAPVEFTEKVSRKELSHHPKRRHVPSAVQKCPHSASEAQGIEGTAEYGDKTHYPHPRTARIRRIGHRRCLVFGRACCLIGGGFLRYVGSRRVPYRWRPGRRDEFRSRRNEHPPSSRSRSSLRWRPLRKLREGCLRRFLEVSHQRIPRASRHRYGTA